MHARKGGLDNPVTIAALNKSSKNPSTHSESTVRASFLVACRCALHHLLEIE